MLSRIVAPVSCQPIEQGLPPEPVTDAEPVPPHGRNGGELPASQQSVMPLSSKQDRETSGESRTQADLSHLDRRIDTRLFAATGSVYHVRLQP